MKSSYKIFDGDGSGIVFFRADTAKTSKVSVKNESMKRPFKTYTFRNIPADTFQSPYISWANLNCVGGWSFNDSYLLTAVQEGKKLCAGISKRDEGDFHAYLDSLSDEYPHYCPPPLHNGPNTIYNVDVTRKGSISDYLDMDAVRKTYLALGIDFLDFGALGNYADMPMLQLLDGTAGLDYGNPRSNEHCAVTGLLLGYPLESTASFICE